jgi:predicted MFS family arabinose efflux permease
MLSPARRQRFGLSSSVIAAAGRLLAPGRIVGFRWFWLAAALSVGGDFFSYIAISWLTLQLTGSALALSGVLVAIGIPRAGLMLLGGALTDRLSARRLMALSAFGRAVLMAALTTDAALGTAQLWHLYIYAVLIGTLAAFILPAQGTMLPSLVPPDLIESGNAAINVGGQLARVVGPAAAGLVVARFGPPPSFAIDGACFLLCALAVLRLPIPASVSTSNQGLLRSIGAGFRYAIADRAMLGVLAIVIALNFAVAGPFQIGLVLLARERFAGAASLGIMLAFNALGSVTGTLLGGTLRPRRLGLVFIFVPCATGAITLLLSHAGMLPLAAALMFVFGTGTGLINVLSPSWLQRRSDPAMLGRVMALVNTAALGAVPISMALAGAVGQLSVGLLFVLSGVAQILSAATAATSRSFRRI